MEMLFGAAPQRVNTGRQCCHIPSAPPPTLPADVGQSFPSDIGSTTILFCQICYLKNKSGLRRSIFHILNLHFLYFTN